MSRLTVAWSMVSAICGTIGLAHIAVWGYRRSRKSHLLFGLAALAAAANALAELAMFTAPTVATYMAAHRASLASISVLIVLIVWYAYVYSGVGRPWLVVAVTVVWCAVIAIDIADTSGPIFREITALRTARTSWGEPFSLAVGVPDPTRELLAVGDLLLAAFLLDLSWTTWRRGHRRSLVVALSIVALLVASVIQARMVDSGHLEMPYMTSFIYLAIITIAGYPLTADVIGVEKMAGQLEETRAGLIESRNVAVLATDEAQRAEEWFRRVFEAAPSAMILTDNRGTIRLVNGRAEAVFGYTREELTGLPIETLVPARYEHARDRKEYFEKPSARVMGVGRDLHGRRKDGTEVPVEVGLSPVQSRNGPYVLASVIDITERQRSELEFERLRNEVAHLSRLTTIGELAGSLAHELNQPLTAILSNAQAAQRLLERTPQDLAEVTEILHDIVESDKHAGEVIRRLRAMLRKEDERFEALDMTEIVQDVLKLARSDLLNHGIVVTADLAAGLPPVAGDRVQLLQVLLNLVLNGCDAMERVPRDRRRLDFGTEPSDGGVHVWVRDSGGGIPEGAVDKVFEPFFTTKNSGMGLGLSVCRTIVAAHGGTIWATNNAVRGATLHVRLPGSALTEAPRQERDE